MQKDGVAFNRNELGHLHRYILRSRKDRSGALVYITGFQPGCVVKRPQTIISHLENAYMDVTAGEQRNRVRIGPEIHYFDKLRIYVNETTKFGKNGGLSLDQIFNLKPKSQ